MNSRARKKRAEIEKSGRVKRKILTTKTYPGSPGREENKNLRSTDLFLKIRRKRSPKTKFNTTETTDDLNQQLTNERVRALVVFPYAKLHGRIKRERLH